MHESPPRSASFVRTWHQNRLEPANRAGKRPVLHHLNNPNHAQPGSWNCLVCSSPPKLSVNPLETLPNVPDQAGRAPDLVADGPVAAGSETAASGADDSGEDA
jgi:hypothetical protein